VGKGGIVGGVQWGMGSDGQHLFAAVSDVVPRRRTTVGPDDLRRFDLDPTQGGGITALRVENGRTTWHVPGHASDSAKPGCSPAQSAAITAIAGALFSGSLDGHLRAFAAEDGALLWDFDTARTYQTVNGVVAMGGSLDGAGPVIAGGMIFANSGYARFGGMPGNVLLAFAPEP
jgi:polyvinyl alcohol dehydrogenase (cytochrome)